MRPLRLPYALPRLRNSSRARARGITVAAGVTALAVTLSGCALPFLSTSDEVDPLNPRSMSAEWQAENFPAYYAQDIEWEECTEVDGYDEWTADGLEAAGYDLDQVACASVAAPLDWEDPSNEASIDLRIVHLPAPGGEPLGTLLANPGGPGATGVDFMLGMALSPGFEEVGANYDLLGFDPRGIGSSSPLACDGAGSELTVVQLGACVAEEPLAHTMGTSQVARDMELLRALAGDPKLNFLGYSYGTMLGATYATIFPELVGRMVLDSAENAQWASPIHLFDQAVAIANATVALATACQTEYQGEVEVCPFVDEDSLLAVLAGLNADPLVASDGTRITGDDLQGYLTSALYESHVDRGRTLDTIALALFGDQVAIDAIGENFSGEGIPDMAMLVVTCHSFPIEPDIPGLLAHIEEVGMPRLLGGPEITDATLAPFIDLSCYALPESGLDITDAFDAAGADPILVIGITGDHATPFQYAQVLVDELGDATLLTLDGQGHSASFSDRSTCVDEAVSRYLVDGTMPAPGTVCLDD